MSKIDVKVVDDITVATINTKWIASDEEVHEISREIKNLLSTADVKKVLLNMENVEAMASLMVGELIMLRKVFEKNSASFRLCSVSPVVVEALQITGICELLEIDDNQAAGLENLKS